MARLEGYEPTHGSDKDLTIAFQHGDDGAFEEIYARHQERVRITCRKLLGNPSEAEEATQETFLRCYRSLGRFNGRYQLGAWLTRIASNICLDLLRARARTISLSGTPVEEIDLEADGKAVDLTVEDSLQVSRALEEIQPLHAEALFLRAIEGLSHEEMAGRLAMTPQQVKSLLHRSRSSFRRIWDTASGWALAPIAGVRSLLATRGRDTSVAGQGVALTASPGSALLAEKVAAGAVAVAVVLGGAPAPERSVPNAGRPSTPRSALELRDWAAHATGPSPASEDRAEEDEGAADTVAAVLDEVATAEHKLKRAAQKSQPDEEDPDEVPDDGPDSQSANKEVRKVVAEAKETLRDLP